MSMSSDSMLKTEPFSALCVARAALKDKGAGSDTDPFSGPGSTRVLLYDCDDEWCQRHVKRSVVERVLPIEPGGL